MNMTPRKEEESAESSAEGMEKGLVEGLIEALADKHSQLDINFQKTIIRIPSMQISFELNGLVTLTSHIRDLTEEERQASTSKNIALLASK
jgi:hypothetical protein